MHHEGFNDKFEGKTISKIPTWKNVFERQIFAHELTRRKYFLSANVETMHDYFLLFSIEWNNQI